MHVPPRSYGSAKAVARQSFVARRLVLPTQAFFHTEGPGGVLLLVCSIIALGLANSPWSEPFAHLLETHLSLELGPWAIRGDIRELINDGLMTIFFYVVGLEIKRELIEGRLSSPRKAALPVVAALGGMVVPALLYAACNLGGAGRNGWGIPMATDIAFAVGVLILLGDRIPASARIFLLALAITDDIGAILVIAVFYSSGVSWPVLGLAAVILIVIVAMIRAGVQSSNVYLVASLAFWAAMLGSGIHATLAGVILGATTPIRPWFSLDSFEKAATRLLQWFRRAQSKGDHDRAEAIMGQFEELSRGTESQLDRRLRQFHPWSSYLVLPLFALANSGVALNRESLGQASASGVTWGIFLGLLIGKPLGIVGFAWLATKLRIASQPEGSSWSQLIGVGMVAGIGFTVSLFITSLAFEDPRLITDAKIGVLVASVLSGIIGFTFLKMRAPGELRRRAVQA
ncbi:Na+/H+ antiporter NhaA [Tundrisphaera lichenicola]|uniref:Na+/H+ antiporter NhaA n=1 Tax=Tundrisphaera lichenicola TaxID=2029860 RepID=UPI003EBC289C